MTHALRNATADDCAAIAELWHRCWHEAHAAIVPGSLTQFRTKDSFIARSKRHFSITRVAELEGELAGFCMTHRDELYQLYVGPEARGTGLAAALIRDAENVIRARGHRRAWLGCSIGNDRAARFYRKSGWLLTRDVMESLETTEGPYVLRAWRFEKGLGVEPASR